MVQAVEASTKTFTAAAALAPYLRVKITDATTEPPTVNVAGATDVSIGTVARRAYAAGDPVSILLANAQGSRIMIASATEALTCGNPVYAAASGKVAASGTVVEGRALTTSAAADDQLEVMSLANTDISSSIAQTNAAAFEVDADASTPKIALSGQSAGTGNFTTTLKPEATLSADTYVIVPETTDGDTLLAATLAQTVPGIKTFTGGIILSGAVDLQFSGTTGQPEILLTTNLADALSFKDGAGDLIVFDLTTGTQVITITPALTVTGTLTANGVLAGGGKFRPKSITTPVAAAGSAVGDAGQLGTACVVHITSDGAAKGVKLPTGVLGDLYVIINDSGTAAELYAAAGGTINGLGADASVVIPASKGVLATCTAADTWIAFDLPAKASAS